MSVREVNTARIQSLKGHSFDGGSAGQKFTDTDSTPVAGIESTNTYDYSIVVAGDTTALYKVKLVGKIGSETTVRTAEIEVFHDEVESKLLTNIRTDDVRFEAFRVYSSPSTTFTLRISNDFSATFYFSIYTEGWLYNAGQSGFSGAEVKDFLGNRGIIAGGYNPPNTDAIDYVTISIPAATASDWGNLFEARRELGGCSDGSRGVFGGGRTTADASTVDYIAIGTPATTATDWGDLSVVRAAVRATSSATRGVFFGGWEAGPSAASDIIDYMTIQTSSGTASDFGNLSVARSGTAGTSDGYRAVMGGGYTGTANLNVIDYITISTPATTATDFGDISAASRFPGACSNGSRGVFGGGYSTSFSSVIDYVTIATPNHAIKFGSLSVARYNLTAASNGTRAIWAGGSSGSYTDVIDYAEIDSPGDGTDFGNMVAVRYGPAATSGD